MADVQGHRVGAPDRSGPWRAGGWSGVILGVVLVPLTGGVSLVATAAGAAAIAHAVRLQDASRDAAAEALLATHRTEPGSRSPWDPAFAGAWLTAVAERRGGTDDPPRAGDEQVR